MKTIGRIITVLLVVFLLAFVSSMLYLNLYGKDFLKETLTEALDQPVEFQKIVFKPPFVFHLINFNIGEDITANRVEVYPHFNSFFSDEISINRLVLKEANITINEEPDVNAEAMVLNVTEVLNVTAIPTPESLKKKDDSDKKATIQLLVLETSTINYTDKKNPDGISFSLNNVDLEAQNIVVPRLDEDVYFTLTSMLNTERKELNGGRVNAEGWLNWGKRNMQSTLNVQGRKLKDALNVVLTSTDNDLKVEGEIKLKDFGIEIPDEDGEDQSLKNFLSDVLSTVGIDVGAKFNFMTKMDAFEITNVAFKGSIVP